ncbi:3-bisphosphoglycerate-dependent phosphoglyceratemutase [Striga asiatica]|uniref:3-bisphosphoglycerate-dependent phosphoglyceratemutase n=1 Tax=Striga asiatica TaxID=4170 RepID=A0A5A7Q9M0_STRAF|nr:3-bisphosphoglycerate-dependent phosphoglyceratemutase [Striga asiatica]
MRNMYGTFYHDRGEVRGRKSSNFRKQYSHKVWVPAIPSWEKEFCQTIGLFTWENFLKAKRESIHSPGKIIDWDDSAAKDAFDHAKNAFFAKKFNIEHPNQATNYPIPGPDLYIDKIKWDDDGVSPDNEFELSRAASDDDEEEEEDGFDHSAIDVNMIKPTGWIDDNDQVYFSSGKVLVGLVIGY